MERIIALVLAGTVSFALAGAAQADSRMGDGPRGGQMMPNFSSLDADKDGKITKEEMMEAMGIATLVGGTIVIPHLRRAYEFWEALENN